MHVKLRTRAQSDAGAALVELAAVMPLLVLILIGTIDFARVFYMSNELSAAARAGAHFGAYSNAHSVNEAGIIGAAEGAAPQVMPFTVTIDAASTNCKCQSDSAPSSTATACVPPLYACSGGTHPVYTITVRATKTFRLVASAVPGIPNNLTVTRVAEQRLAN